MASVICLHSSMQDEDIKGMHYLGVLLSSKQGGVSLGKGSTLKVHITHMYREKMYFQKENNIVLKKLIKINELPHQQCRL